MIDTREKLREYVYSKLGKPLIQVEITDSQMDYIIDEVIQKFCDFSYDGELVQYLKFNCQGRGEYLLSPEVEEVTQINQSGLFYSGYDVNGYVDQNLSNFILSTTGASLSYLVTLSATRSLTSKFFGNSVNFEYNSHRHSINILQDFYGPLLVECYLKYIPKERDKIYDHQWIKAMCVAQAKVQWGGNVGKYSQVLIGGASVNFDRIISEGKEEIQLLNEELLSRWTNPAPIHIS